MRKLAPVQEKDYRLPAICELENFIKLNKHLPGMPTAEQITKEGLDIEQIIVAQTKHIEELTLYLINIQIELDLLKQKINEK